MHVSRIVFYDEPSVPEIDLDGLVRFAEERTGAGAEKRGPIMSHGGQDAPALVASAKLARLDVPFARHEPAPEEVRLENETNPRAACYDGIELQNAFAQMIPDEERMQDVFHVVFTDRLCCTYDPADYRYHGRAVICSNPAVISTTGMVEAPARPREYYLDLIAGSRMGGDLDAVEQKHARTFLKYHDERLFAATRGYFLQALIYYVSGEAFCDSRDCMLYNAHWQSELLHAQVKVGRLCKVHEAVLESMRSLAEQPS